MYTEERSGFAFIKLKNESALTGSNCALAALPNKRAVIKKSKPDFLRSKNVSFIVPLFVQQNTFFLA
jgi:hypothetical protein